MDKIEKNYSSFIIFILVIVIICVGGYYLIKYQNNNHDDKVFNNNQSDTEVKIDDSKDYIYFTNEEKISDSFSVTYKDININLNNNDAIKLQDELNDKMSKAKESIVKKNETDEATDSDDVHDDIYSANIIEYKVYETSKFLSLIVSSYTYNANNVNSDPSNLYYVFDLTNGNIADNNSILKEYNITDQEVRTKIRDYLNTVEESDIDEVLNEPYYLVVADNGKVMINFVVKTTSFNYNESIEMD